MSVFDRLRRWLPFLGRRSPKDVWVKVAGTIHQVEVDVWRQALERQDVGARIVECPPEALPPTGRPSWEIWVRTSEEPKARLVLGLSGRSVIRLPRRKGGEERQP